MVNVVIYAGILMNFLILTPILRKRKTTKKPKRKRKRRFVILYSNMFVTLGKCAVVTPESSGWVLSNRKKSLLRFLEIRGNRIFCKFEITSLRLGGL